MKDLPDDIIRNRYDERVFHWRRVDPNWPGHITYIAVRFDEVEFGDRYLAENYECAFRCRLREFLDGCFHDSARKVFGEPVLAEVVAAVRAEVGPEKAVASPVASPVASKPAPEAASRAASEPGRPSETAPRARSDGRVDVAIVSCPRVDLTLATTLRTVTRASMNDLLSGLRKLPYVVASNVTVTEALAMEERLAGLGATIELQ